MIGESWGTPDMRSCSERKTNVHFHVQIHLFILGIYSQFDNELFYKESITVLYTSQVAEGHISCPPYAVCFSSDGVGIFPSLSPGLFLHFHMMDYSK